MREVNIRQLKAKLSAELKYLPFAVTNNGRIIGYMVTDCSHNDSGNVVTGSNNSDKCSHNGKSVHNLVKAAKEQLSNITKEKNKVTTSKAAIPTGVRPWINPLVDSALAPKK